MMVENEIVWSIELFAHPLSNYGVHTSDGEKNSILTRFVFEMFRKMVGSSKMANKTVRKIPKSTECETNEIENITFGKLLYGTNVAVYDILLKKWQKLSSL